LFENFLENVLVRRLRLGEDLAFAKVKSRRGMSWNILFISVGVVDAVSMKGIVEAVPASRRTRGSGAYFVRVTGGAYWFGDRVVSSWQDHGWQPHGIPNPCWVRSGVTLGACDSPIHGPCVQTRAELVREQAPAAKSAPPPESVPVNRLRPLNSRHTITLR